MTRSMSARRCPGEWFVTGPDPWRASRRATSSASRRLSVRDASSETTMMRSTSETSLEKPPFAALPNRTTLTNDGRSCGQVWTSASRYLWTRAGSRMPEAESDVDTIVIPIRVRWVRRPHAAAVRTLGFRYRGSSERPPRAAKGRRLSKSCISMSSCRFNIRRRPMIGRMSKLTP